jgi:hypothetical protein
MRRRGVAAATHFGKADAKTCFGELPRGLGSCEAAANDVKVKRHGGLSSPASARHQMLFAREDKGDSHFRFDRLEDEAG